MDVKAYGRFLRNYAIFCFVIMVLGLAIPLYSEWHNSIIQHRSMFSDSSGNLYRGLLIAFALNCISSIPCFFIGLWMRRERYRRAITVGIPFAIIMALPSILYLVYPIHSLLFKNPALFITQIPSFLVFVSLTILSLVFTAKGLVLVRRQEQRPS